MTQLSSSRWTLLRKPAIGCLGLLFLICVALWVLIRAERDRRAPIVFDIPAMDCELSPGGRYMWVLAEEVEPGEFFDTQTGQKVSILLPPELEKASIIPWLQDETFFYYSEWKEHNTQGRYFREPTNGWMIDVANRVVTNVLDLDPVTRQKVLSLAKQRILERYQSGFPIKSPDGSFLSTGTSIIEIASKRVVNDDMELFSGGQGCLSAWRPDSSGYYFFEGGYGGFSAARSGRIRLLLTDPAP